MESALVLALAGTAFCSWAVGLFCGVMLILRNMPTAGEE